MKMTVPLSNTQKGKLGEQAFYHALSDFPIICNITYGKRQKDIDHLVLTSEYLVFNENKNNNEDFEIYYSWFLDHVVDRYSDGLPVAQWYARTLGYSANNIVFTLTLPYLKIAQPIVAHALKGLKINVIETRKQILDKRSLKDWREPIREQFLSVKTVLQVNTIYSSNISSNQRDPSWSYIHTRFSKLNSILRKMLREFSANTNASISFPSSFKRKIKLKKKRNKKGKIKKEKITCESKVLVLCNQFKAFYLCLDDVYDKLLDDCLRIYCLHHPCFEEKRTECYEEGIRCPGVFCCIEAGEIVNNLPIFKNKQDKMMAKCDCRVKRSIDVEIIEKEPINEMSRFEPCEHRCAKLRQLGRCYLEDRQYYLEDLRRMTGTLAYHLRRAKHMNEHNRKSKD